MCVFCLFHILVTLISIITLILNSLNKKVLYSFKNINYFKKLIGWVTLDEFIENLIIHIMATQPFVLGNVTWGNAINNSNDKI